MCGKMADEPLELWIYDNAGWENVFYASLYMAHQEKKIIPKGTRMKATRMDFQTQASLGHIFGLR